MQFTTVQNAVAGCSVSMNSLLVDISSQCRVVVDSYLGRKYGARIDADDVLQEALMQIASGLKTQTFDKIDNFDAWCWSVCRNTTYKQVAKIKAAKRSADRTCVMADGFDAASEIRTPDEIVVGREEFSQVMWLAAGLSDTEFEVVEKLGIGTPVKEIADTLGLTASQVYNVRRKLVGMVSRELAGV